MLPSLNLFIMGVFGDFLNDIWQSTIGGAVDTTADSLGLSRHGRDQVVNQENALRQMEVQNEYARQNWNEQFQKTNEDLTVVILFISLLSLW